jgi:hypothetical protein
MLKSFRPKTDHRQAGMKKAVQESSPWSKSSPKGPLVLVRRACLPSMPSGGHGKHIDRR